jgi:hypothetical protein
MLLQLSEFRRQNLAPHLKKRRGVQGLAEGFYHAPRENRVQKSNTGPILEDGRRTNPFSDKILQRPCRNQSSKVTCFLSTWKKGTRRVVST